MEHEPRCIRCGVALRGAHLYSCINPDGHNFGPDTDRFDRFVSEMQIFKTPEEAWTAADAHKAKLKAERAARLERLKVQREAERGEQ